MRFWKIKPTDAAQASEQAEEIDLIIYGHIAESQIWSDDVGARQLREELDRYKAVGRINVRINSHGGDAFAGIAIQNILAGHPAEIAVTIEGIAGSAASVIAMAGRNRTVAGRAASGRVVMAAGAMVMVHNPAAIAIGEAEEMRKTADVLDKVRDSLVAIYRAKTGKTAEELQALLDAETWLTADEAVAEGFADDVAGEQVQAETRGELIFISAVGFPRSNLPQRIVAMARPTAAPAERPDERKPEAAPALDRFALERDAPQLLTAILAEGYAAGKAEAEAGAEQRIAAARAESAEAHAAALSVARAEGIAAERARIHALESCSLPGHARLLAAAKYGAPADEAKGAAAIEPMSPEAFAVALIEAERSLRNRHLDAAQQDAVEAAAGIVPGSSGVADPAAEVDRAGRAIAKGFRR